MPIRYVFVFHMLIIYIYYEMHIFTYTFFMKLFLSEVEICCTHTSKSEREHCVNWCGGIPKNWPDLDCDSLTISVTFRL